MSEIITKEFQWTDELVREFCESRYQDFKYNLVGGIQQFKQFHPSHSSDSGGQKDKDWEIVEGVDKYGKRHEWFTSCIEVGCKIHSVKRLSDNSVWAIGDEIDHKDAISTKRITSFYITDKNEMACYCSNPNSTANYFIENWVKLPPERSEDDFENIDRPPLGIIPTTVWKTTRLNELESAIIRYVNARREIPKAWITERDELLGWVKSLNLKYDWSKIKI